MAIDYLKKNSYLVLFPAVKKLKLGLWWFGWNKSIQEVNEVMTPYQNLGLEEVIVRCDGIQASPVLIAVLESVAIWKGWKFI